MFEIKLKSYCKKLNDHGAYALKASFEDEGVSIEDLDDLVCLGSNSYLQIAVKIGGAEANSDIIACLRRGVSDIVAPMVETTYAAQKFVSAMKNQTMALRTLGVKSHLNIETHTAAANSKFIIEDHSDYITGIVVGRSDLAQSLGLTKSEVDSKGVMEVARSVFTHAKLAGLTTTLGGSISSKSASHIKSLTTAGLLDRFETRAVVFNVGPSHSESDIKLLINMALEYEQLLLERRMAYSEVRSYSLRQRIKAIEGRKE